MLAAPSVRLHLDLSRLQARGCLGRAICGTPLDVCEAHTMSVMRSELEEAVDGWHRAARSGDLTCARSEERRVGEGGASRVRARESGSKGRVARERSTAQERR